MCNIFEDVYNEGKSDRDFLLIPKMLKRGDSFEEIAEFLEITVDEVMRIAKLAKA